jgi:hypothetical protein
MRSHQLLITCLCTAAMSATAAAGIPEPDVILYGQVCIDGQSASSEDDVVIVAKAFVDAQLVQVGRYKMGDHPAATDCNGDADCYVLHVRIESVPSGESATGRAAILNRANPTTVYLFLVQDGGAELFLTGFDVTDSGMIRRLDLSNVPGSPDLNGDGHTDLVDYQMLHAMLLGPVVLTPIVCNPADLNRDGHIDLGDFAILQNEFTGS